MPTKSGAEIDWKEESRRFDAVAELYDACRPSYPAELFRAIVSISGTPPGGRILEIGSGTGISTAPFVQRGFSILCIEPGRNLVAVAEQKFRDCPNVEFELARFEDWTERAKEFDLVMAAQAFHWIPSDIGYVKAARALKPSGFLALYWNRYLDLQDTDLREDLDRVYRECSPEPTSKFEDAEEVIKKTQIEIDTSGCFCPVLVQRFPWVARYTTDQYVGLLNTYSDHLRLPGPVRKRLLAGIVDVVYRHGGYVDKPYLAVLYMAQKR